MKALAPNNRLGFIAIPLALLALLTIVLLKLMFTTYEFTEKRVFIFGGLYLTLLCWLLLASRVSDLFFDSDFLYFKRGNSTRKVPLKDIRSMYRTRTRFSFMGFGPYQYRIEYNDATGLQTTSLWVMHESEELLSFQEEVRRAKTSVKISNDLT